MLDSAYPLIPLDPRASDALTTEQTSLPFEDIGYSQLRAYMPRQPIDDPSLLAAALDGLELQKERIDAQIRQVRALMGGPQRRPRKPARA